MSIKVFISVRTSTDPTHASQGGPSLRNESQHQRDGVTALHATAPGFSLPKRPT
jgi:hypothetical protein